MPSQLGGNSVGVLPQPHRPLNHANLGGHFGNMHRNLTSQQLAAGEAGSLGGGPLVPGGAGHQFNITHMQQYGAVDKRAPPSKSRARLSVAKQSAAAMVPTDPNSVVYSSTVPNLKSAFFNQKQANGAQSADMSSKGAAGSDLDSNRVSTANGMFPC